MRLDSISAGTCSSLISAASPRPCGPKVLRFKHRNAKIRAESRQLPAPRMLVSKHAFAVVAVCTPKVSKFKAQSYGVTCYDSRRRRPRSNSHRRRSPGFLACGKQGRHSNGRSPIALHAPHGVHSPEQVKLSYFQSRVYASGHEVRTGAPRNRRR